MRLFHHPILGLSIVGALALLCSAPAPAKLATGVSAFEQGNFPPAMLRMLPAATRGDRDAQHQIGTMYYEGLGIEQDYAEAARWWHKAALQDHRNAQYNLGVMYHQGQGVQKDPAEAAMWWRMAAEQGHAEAQYNLGIVYCAGRGVPVNYDEATKWYRKAAEQGREKAQYNLGVLYAKGEAVPPDYVQAHAWFSLAAAESPPGAFREKAEHNRDIVAARLTPAQLDQAQRLARDLMAQAE